MLCDRLEVHIQLICLKAREVEGKPCLQGDDKSPPRNREETALQALPQENDPEARDRLVHKDGVSEVQEPTVRLRDLKWPEEPDPSIWQDPLRRDELKPMRQYELQAIGMSKLTGCLSRRKGEQLIFSTC